MNLLDYFKACVLFTMAILLFHVDYYGWGHSVSEELILGIISAYVGLYYVVRSITGPDPKSEPKLEPKQEADENQL